MEICLNLSPPEALLVAQRMRPLIEQASGDEERSALEKTLLALSNAGQAQRRAQSCEGFIDWTLDDESYQPFGRQFDIRVYYDWVDFDAGDRTTPAFGGYAEIVDIEVTGVSYFDEQGESRSPAQQHLDAAWELVTQESSRIEEACTRAGKAAGVSGASGQCLPLADAGRRTAPSARQRSAQGRRLASG